MVNLTLYHQSGCGQCKVVEMLLKKDNLEYESVMDVEEMIRRGIRSTPVLEVRDNDQVSLIFGAKDIKNWIEQQKRA